MAQLDTSFKANSAERLLQPPSAQPSFQPIRYLSLMGAVAIYAVLLALLLLENSLDHAAPAQQEIPVEIVIEPPPENPEPPQPKPEPEAMTRPLDEEPAYDAPRAPTEKKSEIEAPDEGSKSTPAPAPKRPPNPSSDAGKASGQTKEAEVETKENSIETLLDKSAVEALPPVQQEPEKQAKAEGNQLPTFDSVPDVDFEGAIKQTPIAGGKAKATYLTILYGMIMSHLRPPSGPRARLEGAILFSVDGRGNLAQRRIAQSSGSRELDRAAYDAIGQASPFPPPPQGAPIGLRFSYGAN
jgi:TonB family protein